jgi:Flp pilus assembly protein TadG
MRARSIKLPSIRKCWAELARSRRGTTAIEFAIVGAPFVALMVAILESGLVFFAQMELQTATTQAARLIMTGQAQLQGLSPAQFKSAVCANAAVLFDCNDIYVNVQVASSFSSMTQLNPLVNGQFNNTMNYSMGGPDDIVVVQVFYPWPIIIGPLGFNLSNMNGNQRLLVGTSVFRNEPY